MFGPAGFPPPQETAKAPSNGSSGLTLGAIFAKLRTMFPNSNDSFGEKTIND
jgi:hypothetical protein